MTRREQLEELLKADPDDVFLNYALALACISEGNAETGLRHLQQVIDDNPDYVAAYYTGKNSKLDIDRAFGLSPNELGEKTVAFAGKVMKGWKPKK
ncbi:MAG: hypothetical protein IIA00_05480 [Proteobacteria bacterium]|nr:hypothetical protein [Pseudomonadota bacterium]